MKVYIAGRFQRYPEFRGYAKELVGAGYECTSSWLNSVGEIIYASNPKVAAVRAGMDLADIKRSDVVVMFSDSGPKQHGGRHVETGYAIALGIPVVVVGRVENIFHNLPCVNNVASWEDASKFIESIKSDGCTTAHRRLLREQFRILARSWRDETTGF